MWIFVIEFHWQHSWIRSNSHHCAIDFGDVFRIKMPSYECCHLIFTMLLPVQVRKHLYIEKGSLDIYSNLSQNCCCWLYGDECNVSWLLLTFVVIRWVVFIHWCCIFWIFSDFLLHIAYRTVDLCMNSNECNAHFSSSSNYLTWNYKCVT